MSCTHQERVIRLSASFVVLIKKEQFVYPRHSLYSSRESHSFIRVIRCTHQDRIIRLSASFVVLIKKEQFVYPRHSLYSSIKRESFVYRRHSLYSSRESHSFIRVIRCTHQDRIIRLSASFVVLST
jgi:plasmid stabilization system protein ParE